MNSHLRSPARRAALKLLAVGGSGIALRGIAGAQGTGVTQAQIKKAGVFNVAMALNPPMVLQGIDQHWYGFNPDLVAQLGAAWGVRINYVATSWDTIIPGLLAHKYDMIGASISATELRKKVINFTDPYYEAGQIFIVNKNNPKHLTSIDALNKSSVTVAYTQSSIEGEIVHRVLPNATPRALTSSSIGDMIAEIESGRSDAFAIVSVLRQPILHKFSWAASVPDNDEGLNPTPVAWGIRKEDTDLLAAVNAFLASVQKSGVMAALKQKDITPANAGLG